MLTKVSLDLGGGPPYQFYKLTCDCCGRQHSKTLGLYMGEAHVLPNDWTMQTTHRPNWPGYALAFDQCPQCKLDKLGPSPSWEASWRARTWVAQDLP